MVIVGIYCGVIAAMFLLLKTVNYRLHHALDEGEVVEHQAKESQGSRGGTEGASDGGATRREDSNGPGYVDTLSDPKVVENRSCGGETFVVWRRCSDVEQSKCCRKVWARDKLIMREKPSLCW